MKHTRQIPKSREDCVTLATLALAGAQAIGAEVHLEQNTPARIAADLYDYTGEPGEGTGGGKRHLFDEARVAATVAQMARRVAVANGREFCGKAVDHLKGYLGRRWGAPWMAVGLSGASLHIPRNPLPLLLGLREYFRTHAAHEMAEQNITADQADTLATAIQTASQNVVEKIQVRAVASALQKAALRKLCERLTGLRTELDQLLDDDDPRWRRFGFSRPIDKRLAEEVEGLTLTEGLPGQVVASWEPSARALDYRVKWKIAESPDEPVELPLVHDLSVIIAGLPSGSTVVVMVSARNAVGDSLPTEAELMVP